MHLKIKLFSLTASILLFINLPASAQSVVADQIVAVVNDHIILKSEVDQRVYEYMQGTNNDQFNEELWYQILESLVDNYVLVEKAQIDSVEVGDDEVNRILDQRINELIQRAGSEQELEQALGSTLIEIKADYRDMFREDMMVERVRQERISRIQITRPEVIDFYNSIPEDSLPTIPESAALSQIVMVPPVRAESQQEAYNKAVQLRDSIITHDVEMEELAGRHSEGPTASNGGRLPMVPTSDLVTEYAAAAAALDPGEVSEVVETSQGYHIIRLNERSGDNISTNHILIKVEEGQLDEEFAISKLEALRDSVINHGKSFSELARTHSEDKNTAPAGGRLVDPQTGQQTIEINRLDAALSRIARRLRDEGEGSVSQPNPFRPNEGSEQAYRIVQLNNYVPEHTANLEMDFAMLRNYALQQKQQTALMRWMQKIRDDVYVEYKIPVPDINPVPPTLPVSNPDDPARAQPAETIN
ncbi:MAG: peptidylprolyl isomerase [Balneolales bacterium]